MGNWRFLTNHALVLIHVANNPRSTLREISYAVDITERATQTILRCLEEDAIISRRKEGRRNRYWVDYHALLQFQLQSPYSVAELARNLLDIGRRLQKMKASSS